MISKLDLSTRSLRVMAAHSNMSVSKSGETVTAADSKSVEIYSLESSSLHLYVVT